MIWFLVGFALGVAAVFAARAARQHMAARGPLVQPGYDFVTRLSTAPAEMETASLRREVDALAERVDTMEIRLGFLPPRPSQNKPRA